MQRYQVIRIRDELTFMDMLPSRPRQEFVKHSRSPETSKYSKKCKVHVQMRLKKLTKYSFLILFH